MDEAFLTGWLGCVFVQRLCRAGKGHSEGALDSLQECEQLQKMYGGHMDERTLEKTQQQHMLYQQEQHHQILHQQIQVLEAVAVFSARHAAAARAPGIEEGGRVAGLAAGRSEPEEREQRCLQSCGRT